MPLPLTPTTGFGKKRRSVPHPRRNFAADQLVELNLIGCGDSFSIGIVDFKL